MTRGHPGHTDLSEPVLVSEEVWTGWERRHAEAVDLLTSDHLGRRRRGQPHPVIDFLFTRHDQPHLEQPACLHAGMDLYAHVATMEAGVPWELLIDTPAAAFEAREVDMRSSPYDLTGWGLDPIRVETPEGRAQFVAHQRRWIARTQILRDRLLAAISRLEHSTAGASSTSGVSV